MSKWGCVVAGSFLLIAVSANSGYSKHLVGGLTASEVFGDPRLADLAGAACRGDVDAVKTHLGKGANPNGLGKDEVTPLLWAVHCENLPGIEALLGAGANPNYKVPGHFTAVYVAAGMHNPGPLKLLLRSGGEANTFYDDDQHKTALREAFSLGVDDYGWDNYYALLDAGANINGADEVGNTIASFAVALGQFDKVVELLERGYNYDLESLGRSVQGRLTNDDPAVVAAKAKAIEVLTMLGVRFPVPPLVELHSGRVRMEGDGTLVVIWYGGFPRDCHAQIKAREEVIEPGQKGYEDILSRVGGLRPFYGKGIPRRPEDPPHFPPAECKGRLSG